jgi:hypothetical protein
MELRKTNSIITNMVTPITPKSILRKLRVAEAINHAIQTQIGTNAEFWGRQTREILDELNADIPDSLALFSGNTTLALALNASQDALNVRDENGNPVFVLRSPTEPGRADIVFNGTAFVYAPGAQI